VILPLGRELDGLVAAGLRILEDFAFVIPDHDVFVVVVEDVTDFILCKDYGNLRAGVLAATCAMTVIGGEVVYEATR
jgi:hypothetical protein